MRIILDDHELPAIAGGAAEALAAVRIACEAQERIITDVFLDDRRLSAPDLQAVQSDNPSGEVLRCTSTTALNLVADTLECVADALNQLRGAHQSIAEKFQASQMAEALGELKDALALWNSVRQGVDYGCTLIRLDIEKLRTQATEVDAALTSLADRLTDIRDALAGEDWSRVSDTIGYEMGPVVDHWQTLVQVLSQRVEAMQDAGDRA
ncbi:MAG: hypothetical protein IT430_01305 [Phycisphaerales bacterium]|nr:hypothetical protein [Phycisphaerales bacterium]